VLAGGVIAATKPALDPLQFRPDSTLGCPGIVNAARAGNVIIANATAGAKQF